MPLSLKGDGIIQNNYCYYTSFAPDCKGSPFHRNKLKFAV